MKRLICMALAGAATATTAQTPAAAVTVRAAAFSPAATGPAENFTGAVRITSPFQALPPGKAGGGTVTFEPRARSAWHTHPLGQTLIVTAGLGLVQQQGQPAQAIRPGDVVTIPANVGSKISLVTWASSAGVAAGDGAKAPIPPVFGPRSRSNRRL